MSHLGRKERTAVPASPTKQKDKDAPLEVEQEKMANTQNSETVNKKKEVSTLLDDFREPTRGGRRQRRGGSPTSKDRPANSVEPLASSVSSMTAPPPLRGGVGGGQKKDQDYLRDHLTKRLRDRASAKGSVPSYQQKLTKTSENQSDSKKGATSSLPSRAMLSSADLRRDMIASRGGLGVVDPHSVETLQKLNVSFPMAASEKWTGVQLPVRSKESMMFAGKLFADHKQPSASPAHHEGHVHYGINNNVVDGDEASGGSPTKTTSAAVAVARGRTVLNPLREERTSSPPKSGEGVGVVNTRSGRGGRTSPFRKERNRTQQSSAGARGHLGMMRRGDDGIGKDPIGEHEMRGQNENERFSRDGRRNTQARLEQLESQFPDASFLDLSTPWNASSAINTTTGTFDFNVMKQAVGRIDKMLWALSRDQHVGQASEGGASHSNSDFADPQYVEELKDIIQVLLKDMSQHSQTLKDAEVAEQKKDIMLKDTTNELRAAQQKLTHVTTQYENAVKELDASRKHVLMLETQLSELNIQFQSNVQAGGGGGLSNASMLAGSFAGSPMNQQAPGNAVMNESFLRSPTGAASNAQRTLLLSPKSLHVDSDDDPEDNNLDSSTGVKEPYATSSCGGFSDAELMPRRYLRAPKGTVAVVCTGIQGISRLWEAFPDDMALASATYSKVMRNLIKEMNGYEVKNVGDEFMVVFASTEVACQFALRTQNELLAQCWSQAIENHPDTKYVDKENGLEPLWAGLRAKIGIHVGDVLVEPSPETEGADYIGATVHRAIALKRIAFGGMTAISKEVYQEILPNLSALGNPSVTFHCRIPSTTVGVDTEIYVLLPVELEDRLIHIKQVTKDTLKALGMEEVLASAEAENVEDLNATFTDIELMVGRTRKRDVVNVPLVNGEGALDWADTMKQDEQKLRETSLPKGNVFLMSIRIENLDLLTKKMQKSPDDLTALLETFTSVLEFVVPSYGGISLSSSKNMYLYVFRSASLAAGCALAIDAELLQADWPKNTVGTYVPLRPVFWREVLVFKGLRACIGIHAVHDAEPILDPFDNQVKYVGREPMLAARLSKFAHGGQVVLSEATCHELLLRLQPLPLILPLTFLGKHSAEKDSENMKLCVMLPRMYVGRVFIYSGLGDYPVCRKDPRYRALRTEIQEEHLRWMKKETLLVLPNRTSDGEEAGRRGNRKQKGEESDEDDNQSGSSSGGDSGSPGGGSEFGEKDEEATQLALRVDDYRARDRETMQYILIQLAHLAREHGPSFPITQQISSMEHNMMLLEDTEAMQGQTLEFIPCTLDISDMRGLFSRYKNDLQYDFLTKGEGQGDDDKESISSAEGGGGSENSWSDSEVGSVKAYNADEFLDRLNAPQGTSVPGKKSPRRHNATGMNKKEHSAHSKVNLVAERKKAQQKEQVFASMEEELAHTKKRLEQSCSEIHVLHQELRHFFHLIRAWLDPVLDSHKMPVMSEEDFVIRIVQAHRKLREKHGLGLTGAGVNSPGRKQENARVEWRELISTVLDKEGEGAFEDDPPRLCRSLLGHMCRYFAYLKQFVKRLKVRDAQAMSSAVAQRRDSNLGSTGLRKSSMSRSRRGMDSSTGGAGAGVTFV